MRVADYIFKRLADYGVQHVFVIVGGGAMHLNDALNKEKRLKYICNHHEQASAIGAEGYSRVSGGLSVVSVTSGPGGTNALTGVLGAWLDSVPMLIISGQVRYDTTVYSQQGSGLRQLGDQEINIVDVVRPITKYATVVDDPSTIGVKLEKAIGLATSGRPGPVWLDIPLNVQGALINEDQVKAEVNPIQKVAPVVASVKEAAAMLRSAKRPIIIAGHGIRVSGAQSEFMNLLSTLKIPVVTTFNGYDLLPTDSEYFAGRIGTLGSRGGNFALQNSDLILSLGSRNNIRQISYNWECYGKNAKKILVDIDTAELNKPTLKGDLLVHGDVGCFIRGLLEQLQAGWKTDSSWLSWCIERKHRYPVVLDEYKNDTGGCVNVYHFIEELTKMLDNDAVTVAGNGTACVVLFQAGVVKEGQRSFWNSGCASMGYALPASIGASLAHNGQVVCITGDGSLQMNLQELQTIKNNNLKIKMFVLNNHGYRSIEQTQSSFFKADFIGCNESSGMSCPDVASLAECYGFKYVKICSHGTMHAEIEEVLSHEEAVLCEVSLDSEYIFSPKLSSEKKPDGRLISKPLEDLYPFLDRDEFRSNMIVCDDSDDDQNEE